VLPLATGELKLRSLIAISNLNDSIYALINGTNKANLINYKPAASGRTYPEQVIALLLTKI
jgi:hypothetical protein